MSYDLNQDAPESFEFVIAGNVYRMRYPNTEEIAEAQEKVGVQKDSEPNTTWTEWFYTFIEPVEPTSPPIAEAMKKANVKVLRGT